MFRAGVLIGSGVVLVWEARAGQWAYRPFPAIRFRRNLAGRQMPNTTGLILASPAAGDCQLNPGLTRATLPSLALGLMDTHLDGWCSMLPDDPRGKRRRMGRLFPRRIIPSVLLGLAAVLDAHGEHAHHAPLRVGRAEATRGCRVPLERRGNRRFSSTSCQIAPAQRLTAETGGSTPTGAAGSTVPGPAGRVAGLCLGGGCASSERNEAMCREHTDARRRT